MRRKCAARKAQDGACILDITPSVLSEHQIVQRQKQVDLGKQSREYWLYAQCVPKHQRAPELDNSWHPNTPNIRACCSSRAFQGLIRCWRRRLHLWGNLSPVVYDEMLRTSAYIPPKRVQSKLKLIACTKSKTITGTQHVSNTEYIAPVSTKTQLDSFDPCFGSSYSVPPCADVKTLRGLIKSSSLWDAAVASSEVSTQLASQFVLFNITESFKCNMLKHSRSTCALCTDLPVAFLPSTFRSIQIWPRCHFIRESDLQNVLADSSCAYVLQKLNKLLAPDSTHILGSAVTLNLSFDQNIPIFMNSTPQLPKRNLPGNVNDGTRLSLTDRLRLEVYRDLPAAQVQMSQRALDQNLALVSDSNTTSTTQIHSRQPSSNCFSNEEAENGVQGLLRYSVFRSRQKRF